MTTLTHDAFLDLLCRDDDLVRTEFDAIVAAAWAEPSAPPDPPAPHPPAAPPAPADRPAATPAAPGWLVPDGQHPRLPEQERSRRGRQRAPPARR